MNKTIKKVIRGAGVLLGLFLALPGTPKADSVSMKVETWSGWKNTGVSVRAGDTVVVRTLKMIRLADGVSANSNGEWLYCWNLDWFARGRAALTASPRPVDSAPGGALVFRIGEGQPFFVPRTGGAPGKDYSQELTNPGWENLKVGTPEAERWKSEEANRHRGWERFPGNDLGPQLEHQFTAASSGILYTTINLANSARNAGWGWVEYNVTIISKKPTDCLVSGKVADETGKALAGAEVQLGAEKKQTGSDGSFVFLVAKDGAYTLNAVKEDFNAAQKAVTVAIAKANFMDLGTVLLKSKPGYIAGKVLTSDGKPAAGALVAAGGVTAAAGLDGAFTLGLNKGVYTLKATKNLPSGIQASGEKTNVEVRAGATAQVGTIVVAQVIGGPSGWMPTVNYVQRGQTLVVKAGGQISYRGTGFGPEGLPGRTMPGMPAAAAPLGGLVAKIGPYGKPFLVGRDLRLRSSESGQLYFAVNLPPADAATAAGSFNFSEIAFLNLSDLEGVILGSDGKPLTMASIELSGVGDRYDTDNNGYFLIKDMPVGVYTLTVKFPGYAVHSRRVSVPLGARSSIGRIMLPAAPVTGSVAIKLLPKSGVTGGLIPVFVEALNTSSMYGLWGGFQVSLKARSMATGKEYAGMAPTYMVLAPGERKGAELLCQIPLDAPAGNYTITAELRVPETTSIQNAAKQFDARKELEDKLAALKTLSGRLASQDVKVLGVTKGADSAKLTQTARLLVPTITPKVFSPSKGQIVTGTIALREKSVIVLGKDLEIFKGPNGEPLVIWNSYQGAYLSSREDGARKDDWFWIGQSNAQSDDFSVSWDTSKLKDGDYLVRATMKTVYDGKPIEGSMEVMVKVRNDPRTGMIRGRVIDENGAPLAGVDVKRLGRGQAINGVDWQTLGTQTSVEWQAEDVAKTNGNGDFAFSNVMSGEHKLQFLLDKYTTAVKDVSMSPGQAFTLPPVALEGEKCRVSGTVRSDDGGAAAGASASLAGPTQLAAAVSEGGGFAFEGLKKGYYRLTVAKNDYNQAAVDFVCAPGETKTLGGLLLTRVLYQVTGYVRDSAGAVIEGANVTLDRTGAATLTDKDGKYSLWNVTGGGHSLAFAKANYEKAEAQFNAFASTGAARIVRVDGSLAPVRPVYAPLAFVYPQGGEAWTAGAAQQIKWTGGNPAWPMMVSVINGAGTQVVKVLTDNAPNSGAYNWTVDLPAGSYLMYIQGNRGLPDSNWTYGKPFTVSLPPGSLTGTLEPASSLLQIDGAAVELHGNKFEASLAAGEHSVRASKDNFETFERKITIQGGAAQTLDIKLSNARSADGYDKDGYDKDGYDKDGYNKAGFNKLGFDRAGFDKDGYDKDGYDKTGFNKAGSDRNGYDKDGYGKDGYNQAGFDKAGFDRSGYDKDGYDKDGFSKTGFNKSGFDRSGFDKDGYDKDGYNQAGFNKTGFDRGGYDKSGFDKSGFDKDGNDKDGYNKSGFNQLGFDRNGYGKDGYDKEGNDKDGYNKAGFNKAGFDRGGFDKDGYDKDGYNRAGFNKSGFDRSGYDKDGYTLTGFNKLGFDRNGYDKDGYDKDGFNKAGFNKTGFDRNGYDKDGYGQSGFNKLGFDRNGYDKDGYDKDGYSKAGFNKTGFDRNGYDKDGYDKDGYSKAGFNKLGFDRNGYDKDGYDKDGFNKAGFNKTGFDRNGYDKDGYGQSGFNKLGFDRNGYDKDGYDKDGYSKAGFNKTGFDRNGYDKDGYDKDGFNKAGFNKSGFDRNGYDKDGYDKDGFNKAGFNKTGFDRNGFDKDGYDQAGFSKAGFDRNGYDKDGYDKDGYSKAGFNKTGFDRSGFDKDGYDKDGFNKAGFNKTGFDRNGYDKDGYNQSGFNKAGFDRSGYDKDGYDKDGYTKAGFNKSGFDRGGYDKDGYDKDGFNKAGFNKTGFDRNGFDKDGYNQAGFNKLGFDRNGYDKDGYNQAGLNKVGFDRSGYDKDGYDKDGFNKAGFNKTGFDRNGYDKEGYNQSGFNKSGFDRTGYDKDGYGQSGFNKLGFDRGGYDKDGYDKDGFSKAGFNKTGFDRNGYDKEGYNQSGFNKLGFDRNGFNKDGYDKDGYNKAGFNKTGFDRNGYDKDGNDKDGYSKAGFNKAGFDRGGYDKAGYDKDGYDKAGYNKAGYNKAGLDRNGKSNMPPLTLSASSSQAYIGEVITLTVQTPQMNSEVELSAAEGQFDGSGRSVISGRSNAKGIFTTKWTSVTPAKHKIKVKCGAGAAVQTKETEVELKYIVPDVTPSLRNIMVMPTLGAQVSIDAQVRNNGKVSGRYRVEIELRGTNNFPVVPLKPMEVQLYAGQTKVLTYTWNVTALSEYTARMLIYLVGDRGQLTLVNTYQAKLTYAKTAAAGK